MERSKKEILHTLKKLGLIIDDSVTHNLTVTLSDVANHLLDDELKLLKEFEALHRKKTNGGQLSFLEQSFYEHIIKTYSKK